jgi:phosphoribosylformylglycinamidine cyclo-ligase
MGKMLPDNYGAVGVSAERKDAGLRSLLASIEQSFVYHPSSRPLLKIGAYANVISLPPPFGENIGVAISTDGVGTKLLVAQMMDRYDTVGVDLVAMNANDVICVGADPLALVDLITAETLHPRLLDEIGRGLAQGAKEARISIPGGEIAQVREMVKGVREGYAFDLVGTCVGVVARDRIVVGQSIEEGDVLLGLASSGIHSNGLTLARDLFFHRLGWEIDRYVPEFGRTLGEELLEPTKIYVQPIRTLLEDPACPLRGLFHITGDGFLNLSRAEAEVGLVIERLPDPPPIFSLMQEVGQVSDQEMYRVFNMGVGLALVVSSKEIERVTLFLERAGLPPMRMGYAVHDPERKIKIQPKGLLGAHGSFCSL